MIQHFRVQPSRILSGLFLALYASALWIWLTVPLLFWLRALGIAWGARLFWYGWQSQVRLKAAHSILAIWHQAGNWHLMTLQDEVITAKLCGDSVSTSYGMILNFKPILADGRLSILIAQDSLTSDEFRKLRWLL
jgi:hypothetical protein